MRAAKKTARKAAKRRKTGRGGRPTAYRAEFVEQVRKLAKLGATDAELADFFCVSEVTVNAWKKRHPEFLKSLKEGKMIADAKVAQALFDRACGVVLPETKFATFEGKITDMVTVEKHYPPDTTAAIFWLKNRQPRLWRDKIDHEVEFAGDITVTLGGNIEDE